MAQLIRSSSPLGEKIKHYINWRYKGNRSCAHIIVTDLGSIKVTTRCHKKDHYPERVHNAYRMRTIHTEFINQYEMIDIWNNRKVKLFS